MRHITPRDVLAIEIYTTAPPFILGSSTLGSDHTLGGGTSGAYWWRLPGEAMRSIKTSRAAKVTAGVAYGEVGTMEIRGNGALHPTKIALAYNTPLRLIHTPTSEVIFTGTCTDFEIMPAKDGSTEVKITAADSVRTLANKMRYGSSRHSDAMGAPKALWPADILREFAAATPTVKWGADYRLNGYMGSKLAGNVWETNLANHLDALVTSCNGPAMWYCSKENIIETRGSGYPTPTSPITFTDKADSAAPVFSYTDLQMSLRASEMVTGLTLEQHVAKLEDGNWHADNYTATTENTAAAAQYGGTTPRLDVVGVAEMYLKSLAEEILSRAHTGISPSRISICSTPKRGTADRDALMAAAATLELLTRTTLTHADKTYSLVISGITHHITPTHWTTDLTFTASAL